MVFRKKQPAPAPTAVQLRQTERHPFGMLESYVPLSRGEDRLYRAVREAVPVVDAAIYKLIRLAGGVSARCADPAAQRELETFLRTVAVGRGQFGINAFVDAYLDSLLTCGRAVGEIVPAAGGRDIAALVCGRVEDVEIREGESPLDFVLCAPDEGGRLRPLPYQELLLFTLLNPEADKPYGVSLLRSLPFLSDVLMKIYNTIGVNWERCGNARFAVVYKPGEGELSGMQAQERGEQLAMLSDDKLDGAVMEGITEKLDEAELLALKGGYEAQAGRRFPLMSQLGSVGRRETERDETVFLV